MARPSGASVQHLFERSNQILARENWPWQRARKVITDLDRDNDTVRPRPDHLHNMAQFLDVIFLIVDAQCTAPGEVGVMGKCSYGLIAGITDPLS